jgi:glucuronosyltransferase
MINEIFKLIRTHYVLKDMDALLQSHIPGVRSIAEVEGEASICIINSHPMTSWPRSLPPTIVPIGALHTRPAKSLPKVMNMLSLVLKERKKFYRFLLLQELQEFADGATDGLIVFTLGSFVPVSSMPKETLDTFVRVFSKIPQRVVWKWEGNEPANISSNVMMVNWLPQQDLLGNLLVLFYFKKKSFNLFFC